MSGHSKWKTIQHKKGAADAKRGKAFSKIGKELTVVAKRGGSNPETNPSLRTAILKAKSVNMPADNIDRAIKKGAGELGGVTYDEVTYEGYAGGGIGVLVFVLTDNKNRAAAEIRHIFTRHNRDFAAVGSVSRGFNRKGQILVDAEGVEEDKLMEIVLEAGADDMTREEDQFEIITDPQTLTAVCDALEKAGIKATSAEVSMLPLSMVPVNDKSVAADVLRFVGDLEDNDDVQNVYTNMEMSEAVMEEMEKSA